MYPTVRDRGAADRVRHARIVPGTLQRRHPMSTVCINTFDNCRMVKIFFLQREPFTVEPLPLRHGWAF
jgi:hypothetical protein